MTFRWPVDRRWVITQHFGENHTIYPDTKGHPGIDIGCPTGTSVLASAAGTVTHAGPDPLWPGRGNYVTIDHSDGLRTYYLHLSETRMSQEDWVAQGDTVGLSGSTGWSTGPHLHFGILRVGEGYRDPEQEVTTDG